VSAQEESHKVGHRSPMIPERRLSKSNEDLICLLVVLNKRQKFLVDHNIYL